MDLQNLDTTTILIVVGIIILFLIGIVSRRSEKSVTHRKQDQTQMQETTAHPDDIESQPDSLLKACPRCGNQTEPKWGDYYHCPSCGFAFTGTGRWTNGQMPRLLIEPLRFYGSLVIALMALVVAIYVAF